MGIPEDVSADLFRRIVTESEREVVGEFLAAFGPDIEATIQTLAVAYIDFQAVEGTLSDEPRIVAVRMFCHSVLNCTLTSLHHLVHGFPLASALMMRQAMESVAMAMLLSQEQTGVWDRFKPHGARFDVGGALHTLRKGKVRSILKTSLGFDGEAWEQALKITALYDWLSHASIASMAFQMQFSEPGGVVLGASFDHGKLEQYRSDFVRRRTAAESFHHLLPVLIATLPRKDMPA